MVQKYKKSVKNPCIQEDYVSELSDISGITVTP